MDGLNDLAGFSGIPGLEPALGALFKFYQSIENIKVYNNQCMKLRTQCLDLLLVLRDNGENMVGTDYIKAVDAAEIVLERISRKIQTWSSWSKPKALLYQSEIKQGIDDLSKDLVHCATRFNMLSHMETLHRQRELRTVLGGNHAEIQEKLQRLLDSTQDIHKILNQPERSITDHMLNIQEAIHADVAGPEQRSSLQQRLLKIHRQTELLPPMIDLTGEVRRIGEHPVNISGGYSDVYLGEWLGDEKVALKLTRGINQTPKAQKRFIKEVAIWRQLQHKNVARLYGVATLGNHIYAVSPWMEHRDALTYIENNPDADRLKILYEIATGLEFLHKHGVVHGDLRGANILISDAEVACITDFGLSVILEEEVDPSSSATGDNHGNSRWMAPELINPELIGMQTVKPNTATDVWSYGMLCLEILSGQRPFHNRTRAPAVISDLISGVRPMRPAVEVTRRGLSDALWDFMQQCWHQNPQLRPPMSDILPRMRTFQSRRANSQSSHKTPGPRLHPRTGSGSISGSSISNILVPGDGARRSSPIPIPGSSSTLLVPTDSPLSATPPSGSQTVFFPASGSAGPSYVRPSSSGSGASPSSNLLNTSLRITGRSPPPPRAPLPVHNKSVSLDAVVPSHGKHGRSTRPATVGAAESSFPHLPLIGEAHELGGDGLGDIMAYLQTDFAGSNDIPVVQLERASTPGPPGVASSLPKSFIIPDHAPSRPVLDIAPSEGSGSFSVSSGHSPTSSSHNEIRKERPLYIKYGKDGVVAAATLSSLVERLIFDSSDFRRDMQFRETFLASYQAFTKAEEVFDLLLERFDAVSSPPHTAEQRASVRYSVLTVLDLWLRGHHVQAKDTPLLERMRIFAGSIQRSAPAPTLVASAQRLTDLIDAQVAALSRSPVPPLTPSSSTSSLRSSKPSEISPQALAQALTTLESERYRKIIPSDFIGWLKGIRDNNGVLSFIIENDTLSYWVQKSILKPDVQSQRSENLRYFLCVAEECRKLRNFSSCCALFAGLASSSIAGLKRTSTLDKPSAKISTALDKLMSQEKNFHAYRKALNASTAPCIPWLRVHLHDVKVIHDSKGTLLKQDGYTDVVNFELYQHVHERIRHILSYQEPPLKPPDGPASHDIQMFVDNQLRTLVVDDTFRDSLQRRAARLAREELADFNSHKQELMATGFIRPS